MNSSIDIRQLQKKKPASSGSQPDKDAGSKATWGKDTSDIAKPESSIWAFLQKDIQIMGTGLPDKIKESFYLELSTLLAAGMDIRASLELIKDEQPKKKHGEIFDHLLQRVIAGSTLSASLRDGKYFTPYEFFSVQIGEETGKLVTVLNELAVYYKKKNDQKRQIIGALTYPVLVMVVACLAVGFMIGYVVPMFADVLKRFGGDLPFITKLVLHASALVKSWGILTVLILITITSLAISQRKKQWFSKWSSAFLLRIPLIGKIAQKIYLSRLSGTMSLLIASRIPLVQALQLVKKMVRFYPIESSLTAVENKILSGISLHKSLSEHSVYPKKMIALIKVGEEVNQLDVFFDKIARQYSAEVEYQTSMLSKFMEPLIIVVLGLIVGVILIAMYLPLFKLGQTF